MKKITIILMSVCLVALLGGAFWWLWKDTPSATSPQPNPPTQGGNPAAEFQVGNISTSTPPESSLPDFLELQTPTGLVRMNNFRRAPVGGEEGGTLVLAQQENYFISYSEIDGSFWIALLKDGTPHTQRVAEQAFLSHLGISEKEACDLLVSVGNPYGVAASVLSPKLSFCGI